MRNFRAPEAKLARTGDPQGNACRLSQPRSRRLRPGSVREAELVERHLPLVQSVVTRIAISLPAHVSKEDLYSSGLVGLLDAVRNFDAQRSASFEAYARVRVRGAVLDELRRLDWVPRSVHAKARKVQAVQLELEQANGATPTDEEMAEALGVSGESYQQLLDEIRPAFFVCLDSAQTSDGEEFGSYYERIADTHQPDPVAATAQRELAAIVSERIQHLPDTQRRVLALYYDEGLRLREIAGVFGVTESRICQIHAQAILAIRTAVANLEAVAA